MKPCLRFLAAAMLAASSALTASAQVLRVEMTAPINESATAYNPGASVAAAIATVSPAGAMTVSVVNGGAGYTSAPTVTFSGGGGSGATATAAISNGVVTAITVTSPGTGYTTAPTVSLSGGSPTTPATATANVTPGAVTGIFITSPGAGYTTAPTVTISGGGGSGATATATIVDGFITGIAITNPGVGYTTTPSVTLSQPLGVVRLAARVVGTSGFSTKFYVDGKLVSLAIFGADPEFAWNPPQPGSYFITAKTADAFGNSATSQPVRVFVTGAKIFNPLPNTLVPNGSSVVISADGVFADGTADQQTQQGGLVRDIEFFVNGTSVGKDSTAPYSVAYQPPGLGVYSITAVATDNYGNTATAAAVSIRVVNPIGAPPIARIVNPPDNSPETTTVLAGKELEIIAEADAGDDNGDSKPDGFLNKVEFYINGVLLETDQTFPYTAKWTPSVAGNYILVAMVFDDKGNVTTSSPVVVRVDGTLPSVTLTSPAQGTRIIRGTKVDLAAAPTGAGGGIASLVSLEFLVDGNVVDSLPKNPQGLNPPPALAPPFTYKWPSGVAVGTHQLSARVTDFNGVSISSRAVTVNVVRNSLPVVSIARPTASDSPSPNTPVKITASARDTDKDENNQDVGGIESVEFFVNGQAVGTPVKTQPYEATWTPTAPGTYTITAKATDSSDESVISQGVLVTVNSGTAPTVSLLAPTDGAVVRVGTGTTLSADASDSDGTITRVQFFANGTAIGAPVTTAPFRLTWTPTAAGIFRITATAVDNAGVSSTSGGANVLVVLPNAEGGDSIASGNYQATTESGRFTAINVGGRTATLVAISNTLPRKVYFFTGMALDSALRFSGTDPVSSATISGSFTDTGLTGQLDNGRATLIGTDTRFGVAATPAPTGYYMGSLGGRTGSTLLAIVGADASVALYAADGTFRDAGFGSLAPNGGFSVTTAGGNRIDGRIDTTTGFLSGSLTGGPGGSFTGAAASGATFSDGFLRNLSTRGQVGTGDNVLIAGFVVAGSSPKQVLVRAIGPSLASFGVTGGLGDPMLEIYSGSSRIASNDNWATDASVVPVASRVGAFTLGSGSLDAAVVLTLQPGSYTAQVSGVGGRTGLALVELYDAGTQDAFSSEKVMNVATRGLVGPAQAQLIAGFVVTGNTAKKMLVRAVGPTLGTAPFNMSNVLADPQLKLVRSDNLAVRENDNWESGNDAVLIRHAASKVGAFPLAAGSRDAAMLLTLPPGTYSAQVTGPGTSTGVALIEVYEVP